MNGAESLVRTLVKGGVDPSRPGAEYQVDALAGATLTSRGVSNLIQYWMSKEGYAKTLANGNILVCVGGLNRIFEVTRQQQIVWEDLRPYLLLLAILLESQHRASRYLE